MDAVVDQLARYCGELRFEHLPDDVVRAATPWLVDSIGCGVGAFGCEAAQIGRRITPTVSTDSGLVARPFGTATPSTTVEAAGFVNSAMIRYLDFNDTFPGGHPNDALCSPDQGGGRPQHAVRVHDRHGHGRWSCPRSNRERTSTRKGAH